jgi:hypothetical protein
MYRDLRGKSLPTKIYCGESRRRWPSQILIWRLGRRYGVPPLITYYKDGLKSFLDNGPKPVGSGWTLPGVSRGTEWTGVKNEARIPKFWFFFMEKIITIKLNCERSKKFYTLSGIKAVNHPYLEFRHMPFFYICQSNTKMTV